MFLSDILNEKKQSTPVFTKEPIISRLSHSFNDAHWSYPYHVHKQETELIYFSQGKASYQINNEIFHVSEGDLLIVNKGCIHSITSDYEDPISCWTCAITDFTMANAKAADCFLSLDRLAHGGRHVRGSSVCNGHFVVEHERTGEAEWQADQSKSQCRKPPGRVPARHPGDESLQSAG